MSTHAAEAVRSLLIIVSFLQLQTLTQVAQNNKIASWKILTLWPRAADMELTVSGLMGKATDTYIQ